MILRWATQGHHGPLVWFSLRNRFLLTVICCPIYLWLEVYHEREAQVIYSLMTDWRPEKYWATNHLLARLYFNSNTQEKTKRLIILQMVPVFRHYIKRKESRQELWLLQRHLHVFPNFWCEKMMLHRIMIWKWKPTSPNKSKWCHASLCCDLLQKYSWQFSIACIGILC